MRLAILIVLGLAQFTFAQQSASRGRSEQAQVQEPQAPPQQQPGGRRGRGGRGGLTTAPTADVVDEKPIVTHHEIQLNGKTLKYTATVAQMPLKNASGETEAHIFYTAYTLDDADSSSRPLTFAFNGGPGAASLWVHMGAMGPKRAGLLDNGDMPDPPFKLVDNQQTWLEQTDLVFIDPVGTGYSRAKSTEIARRMNGVQGDLQSVGEFIRLYITRNDRFLSPLFIAGESYGTFRAAGLAGHLIDNGIAVNGIVLISTVLDFAVLRPSLSNPLAYALHMPTFTADAWYHHKLSADLQKDLRATLKESEQWAMGGYLEALNKGDRITSEERKNAIDKTARLTGLEPRYVEQSNLRLDVAHFTRELLRDQKLTIGRLDGRLTGPSPLDAGETAEFDPSGTLVRPPFQAAFLHYLRSELGYESDQTYYVEGGVMPWDWGAANNYAQTSYMLRDAFEKNPHMKVLVCAAYYDSATPYFSAQYTLNHLGIHPDRQKDIHWAFYEAGHMMYIEKQSRAKLTKDVEEFMRGAIPAPTESAGAGGAKAGGNLGGEDSPSKHSQRP
jgi:carboxypeptidase C (cathepsin A)